jgi:hypothetical protein
MEFKSCFFFSSWNRKYRTDERTLCKMSGGFAWHDPVNTSVSILCKRNNLINLCTPKSIPQPPFQVPILTKYVLNPPHNLEVPSRTSLRILRRFAAPTGEAHPRERLSVFQCLRSWSRRRRSETRRDLGL